MKHYLGTVAYRGTAYSGFQRQSSLRTIQGELERALSTLNDSPSQIKGAGRTDAKVHAKGQTFSFYAHDIKDFDKYINIFNSLLPDDIAILSIKEIDDSFDARHSCSGKKYEYRFCFGKKDPFESEYEAYLGNRDFDVDAFMDAYDVFLGVHDFKNFTTKKEDKDNFIRDIYQIKPTYDPSRKAISILFYSNGFMTYQIRLMVGALLKVGFKKMSKIDIKERLDSPKRNIFSYKAKAEGLTLMEVIYG